MTKNKFWIIIALLIIIAGGYVILRNNFSTMSVPSTATTTVATTTTSTVTATAMYSCSDSKTINASYTTDAVDLALSDGRSLHVPQTQSGSGIRYELVSGTSTDIVFWDEGNDAYMTEGTTTSYQDCIAGTITAGAGTNTFTDASKTFSFSYPSALSVTGDGGGYTQGWMAGATSSGMVLAQVLVPKSYLSGTNFADAKFTVGTSADPAALSGCLTYNPNGPRSKNASSTIIMIHGTAFSVVTSSDAGAGNFYDTTSYRASRNSQCYAIEYTIHYANFANFPKGSVKQFDEAALKAALDSIAQSFAFLQ